MKKLGITCIFCIAFICITHAQRSPLFDYQIRKIDDTGYELWLELFQTENVQFIEVHFLSRGNMLGMETATINKKKDGKRYLAYNGRERQIDLSNIQMTFTHDFGLVPEHSIMVKLMDKEFNLLDAQEKAVEY